MVGEEVYDKFVNRFLLEEGCPRAILTDNEREFSNKLLREGFGASFRVRSRFRVRVVAFVHS